MQDKDYCNRRIAKRGIESSSGGRADATHVGRHRLLPWRGWGVPWLFGRTVVGTETRSADYGVCEYDQGVVVGREHHFERKADMEFLNDNKGRVLGSALSRTTTVQILHVGGIRGKSYCQTPSLHRDVQTRIGKKKKHNGKKRRDIRTGSGKLVLHQGRGEESR